MNDRSRRVARALAGFGVLLAVTCLGASSRADERRAPDSDGTAPSNAPRDPEDVFTSALDPPEPAPPRRPRTSRPKPSPKKRRVPRSAPKKTPAAPPAPMNDAPSPREPEPSARRPSARASSADGRQGASDGSETPADKAPSAPPEPVTGPSVAAPPADAAPVTEPAAEPAVTDPPSAAEPTAEPEAASEPESERKLEVSGSVYTYARMSIAEPRVDGDGQLRDDRGHLQQFSTSIWLDVRAKASAGTFAKLSAIGSAFTPTLDQTTEFRGTLREAYAGGHAGGFELRVGQQILPWGNADVVHAVDFLTSTDLSLFAIGSEARQLGAPAVLATWSPDEGTSPLRLTAVWQPVFTPTRIVIPKGRLASTVSVLPETRPDFAIDNSEAALKLGFNGGTWDLSLIGFSGYNHLGQGRPTTITPERVEVAREFDRNSAIGFEGSAAIDSFILRVEGAYVWTPNADAHTSLRQPSHADAIVGLEHPFGDRFRLNLQTFARVHPKFAPLSATTGATPEEAAVRREVARVNAQLLNFTDQVRPGASALLAYTSEDEKLEVELAAIAYFVGFDWAVQPMVSYRAFEGLKLQGGVQIFGGEENSLGSLARYNGVFAQATYAF